MEGGEASSQARAVVTYLHPPKEQQTAAEVEAAEEEAAGEGPVPEVRVRRDGGRGEAFRQAGGVRGGMGEVESGRW